jgi:hypothetical protein
MERKSVPECIEETIRCIREASAADSKPDVGRHLTKAWAWLEIANHHARETEPAASIPGTRH